MLNVPAEHERADQADQERDEHHRGVASRKDVDDSDSGGGGVEPTLSLSTTQLFSLASC